MTTISTGRLTLTPKEFQQWVPCSHSTMYREIRSGRLKTFTMGRSRRIKVEDAQAWVDSLSGGAA